MPGDPRDTAERIARTSYGRLIAILSARLRDVGAAEDALAGAFEKALATWPERGVPARPEAWLIAVARNQFRDMLREKERRLAATPALTLLAEEIMVGRSDTQFADERLKLLFVCAHPAIDPALHTPLMLQTVLGLDAARIGSAFLVAPSTMGQRLSRAKAKIKAAGIPFTVPEPEHLPDRMGAVLAAIYAAFGTGWDNAFGDVRHGAGLAAEALFLGELVVCLAPDNAEARGLLALMLYAQAREGARRHDNAFVPFNEQDTERWDHKRLAQAERLLGEAASLGKSGRYQLEAAIQSAHIHGRLSGKPNRQAILILYAQLLAIAPSLGAHVGHAGALAESGEPEAAIARLHEVAEQARTYQPWWAVMAHCRALTGDMTAAAQAYEMAIGLADDPALRTWLSARKRALPGVKNSA